MTATTTLYRVTSHRYNPPVAMTDSKHRGMPGAVNTADRESRTEALLVDGLDQYFLGNFEEAIHLWTRVLFIDRNHARARAYINRARTAQSERLRRADEMLHAAADQLDRGDLVQARTLLAGAEHASGADEKVAELWARLERMERTRPTMAAVSHAAVVDARPIHDHRRGLRQFARLLAAAAFAVLGYSVFASPVIGDWLSSSATPPASVPTAAPAPLEVLSRQDVAIIRAKNLYARGRLAEALAVLDRAGDTAGSDREEIDDLRIEIQRWLLAPPSSRSRVSASDETGGRP